MRLQIVHGEDVSVEGAPDQDAGLFGLPHHAVAAVQIVAVPIDMTTSYGKGTAKAPAAIVAASHQVDLEWEDAPNVWRYGIQMTEPRWVIAELNRNAALASTTGEPPSETTSRINALSAAVNEIVFQESSAIVRAEKIPAVLGGDHAAPLGLMRAIHEQNEPYGILHIDAHADLRDAYGGLRWSHASIMFNVLESCR